MRSASLAFPSAEHMKRKTDETHKPRVRSARVRKEDLKCNATSLDISSMQRCALSCRPIHLNMTYVTANISYIRYTVMCYCIVRYMYNVMISSHIRYTIMRCFIVCCMYNVMISSHIATTFSSITFVPKRA